MNALGEVRPWAACLFQDWFSRLSLKESSQAIDEKPCLRIAEYTVHATYLQLENLLACHVIFLLCNPEALASLPAVIS